MDLNKPIEKHKGVNLPHRQQREASISVTFRLADSLPAPVVERLAAERRQLERELAMMGCLPGDNEYRRLEQLQSQKFEELLDRCQGECVLKSDKIAQCVSDALLFFDQQRYQMYAFCIMPNHVHSLVFDERRCSTRRDSAFLEVVYRQAGQRHLRTHRYTLSVGLL